MTIDRALRYLGIGSAQIEPVEMRVDPLRDALAAGSGPTIVCAEAGNVNTGSFDPLEEVADAVAGTAAWLHIDGAFGLWAAASPRFRHLVAGAERADSWATDAHKWLNVPYDCGIAFCAHPVSHRAAMAVRASYLEQVDAETRARRDGLEPRVLAPRPRVPDLRRDPSARTAKGSRRWSSAAATTPPASPSCSAAEPGVEILNDVVLNQVLVRFGDDDELTRATIAAVQEDGTCWLSGTVWQGKAAMRISVSNWRTTERRRRALGGAILAAAAAVAGRVTAT